MKYSQIHSLYEADFWYVEIILCIVSPRSCVHFVQSCFQDCSSVVHKTVSRVGPETSNKAYRPRKDSWITRRNHGRKLKSRLVEQLPPPYATYWKYSPSAQAEERIVPFWALRHPLRAENGLKPPLSGNAVTAQLELATWLVPTFSSIVPPLPNFSRGIPHSCPSPRRQIGFNRLPPD